MSINLLLLRKSFRTGWKRMTLIASSVAVGALILFCFTAVFNAVTDMEHVAWLNNLTDQESSDHQPIDGVDPVYVLYTSNDILNSRTVNVIDMQKSGDNTPEMLPGKEVPDPGEFYASPALVDYINAHPEEHLEYRYGKLIGELPESVIPARDEYYVIRGADYPVRDGLIYLSDDPDTQGIPVSNYTVYQFDDYETDSYFDSAEYNISKAVIYAGIIILLFPVIMLVSIATRLGSVQREQRYAALRLIGVTNGQVTGIIATESFISTVVGMIIGYLLYLLVHPLLYSFTLSESRFWPSQMTVTTVQSLAIAGLTILMSLFANWWGMRHVRTSPLGISQKQKMEKKPGWWRVIPLIISLAALIFMTVHEPQNGDEVLAMTNGFLLLIVLIMFSLVIVTPWLTYHLAQFISRHTKQPTVLIGTKYIRAHARAIARSVSGVVLALFAGSFYIIGTSGVSASEARSIINDGYSIMRDNTAVVQSLTNQQTDELGDKLADRDSDFTFANSYLRTSYYGDYTIEQCLDLNNYLGNLDCGQGQLAGVNFTLATDDQRQVIYADNQDELEQKIEDNMQAVYGENYHDDLLVRGSSYLVGVNGSDTEKLRSSVAKISDQAFIKSAAEAKTPSINPAISNLAKLAYGGMAVTMAVAIVSIVVSTIGGLLERRRSMYMLRLGGMQVSELKHMVIIESLIPLIVMSLVSAGIGAWGGAAFIQIGSTTLHPTITPLYIAIVFGSLAIATIAIYLILPMIDRLTSPEANQTE